MTFEMGEELREGGFGNVPYLVGLVRRWERESLLIIESNLR